MAVWRRILQFECNTKKFFLVSWLTGVTSSAGMGIVHENANFCGSETDFLGRKKKVCGKNKSTVQKKKKEAPVLVPH